MFQSQISMHSLDASAGYQQLYNHVPFLPAVLFHIFSMGSSLLILIFI